MTDELKPCPICGGAAVGIEDDVTAIECTNCRAWWMSGFDDKPIDEIVRIWNALPRRSDFEQVACRCGEMPKFRYIRDGEKWLVGCDNHPCANSSALLIPSLPEALAAWRELVEAKAEPVEPHNPADLSGLDCTVRFYDIFERQLNDICR